MLPINGDPLIGTALTGVVLALALLLGVRRRPGRSLGLNLETTASLKGLAALAVIFCHVGYFLIDDHRFLFPLSAAGGAAVDMFLFLSGFGLALGALKKELKPLAFYRRRIGRLYGPLWLSLLLVLGLDAWRLGWRHPLAEVAAAFLGIIPRANLYENINSPLWYVTLAMLLYVVFPWVYRRRRPFLGVLALGAVSWAWGTYGVARVLPGVSGLHHLHRLAFPLGAFVASCTGVAWIRSAWRRLEAAGRPRAWRALGFLLTASASGYFIVNSAVGREPWREEAVSLLAVMLAVLAAVLSPWSFRLLAALGAVSYEVYLLHWPLMSRHDVLFARLPSWLAVVLWLALLYVAALVMNRLVEVSARFVGGLRRRGV